MESEGSLPHSQVPASCPYPDPARSSPYTHTPLPEDPSNLMSLRRCLGRNKVSIQVQGKCSQFETKLIFTVKSCQHLAQPPSWRTTPCRMSATAYLIYSMLPPYWRLFFYPQPEDVCGWRNGLQYGILQEHIL
jgi:hypothetical protein